MILYRPIAPLTEGTGNGWRSVLTAVVMAALFGTAELESRAPASTSTGHGSAGTIGGSAGGAPRRRSR